MGRELGVNVLRPVLTTSRPSQTMAQMGPLSMSVLLSANDTFQIPREVQRGTYTERGQGRRACP